MMNVINHIDSSSSRTESTRILCVYCVGQCLAAGVISKKVFKQAHIAACVPGSGLKAIQIVTLLILVTSL